MSICPAMFLNGCETVKTEYVYQCHLPASLTQQNNAPYIGKKITWGQCPILYTELLNELKQCNADKRAIKQITEGR